MSKIGKIARRTFLFGSAAVIGGVAFEYYMYKRPAKTPCLKACKRVKPRSRLMSRLTRAA